MMLLMDNRLYMLPQLLNRHLVRLLELIIDFLLQCKPRLTGQQYPIVGVFLIILVYRFLIFRLNEIRKKFLRIHHDCIISNANAHVTYSSRNHSINKDKDHRLRVYFGNNRDIAL